VRILYSACLRARAKVSVCTNVGLTPSADTRTIIVHSHAQHRAARARAPRNCVGHARAKQLRWARAHAASQPSGRTPAIDIARLIARYPPACLTTQSTS